MDSKYNAKKAIFHLGVESQSLSLSKTPVDPYAGMSSGEAAMAKFFDGVPIEGDWDEELDDEFDDEEEPIGANGKKKSGKFAHHFSALLIQPKLKLEDAPIEVQTRVAQYLDSSIKIWVDGWTNVFINYSQLQWSYYQEKEAFSLAGDKRFNKNKTILAHDLEDLVDTIMKAYPYDKSDMDPVEVTVLKDELRQLFLELSNRFQQLIKSIIIEEGKLTTETEKLMKNLVYSYPERVADALMKAVFAFGLIEVIIWPDDPYNLAGHHKNGTTQLVSEKLSSILKCIVNANRWFVENWQSIATHVQEATKERRGQRTKKGIFTRIRRHEKSRKTPGTRKLPPEAELLSGSNQIELRKQYIEKMETCKKDTTTAGEWIDDLIIGNIIFLSEKKAIAMKTKLRKDDKGSFVLNLDDVDSEPEDSTEGTQSTEEFGPDELLV